MSRDEPQLWMFHFRCPLCGCDPGALPLREFLHSWQRAERGMVADLLMTTGGALLEICDRPGRWPTKKIKRELERFWIAAETLTGNERATFSSHLAREKRSPITFDTTCVVCCSPAGSRRADNYFTSWREACLVQTGNLLYEVGLILWTVVSTVPAWADSSALKTLSDARLALHQASRALNLMICPQCGRPTTTLGGGTSEPEADGHCRWCSDMGGGLGFELSVTFRPDGTPAVELQKSDGTAPGRTDRDLLPPEVTAIWEAIDTRLT